MSGKVRAEAGHNSVTIMNGLRDGRPRKRRILLSPEQRPDPILCPPSQPSKDWGGGLDPSVKEMGVKVAIAST